MTSLNRILPRATALTIITGCMVATGCAAEPQEDLTGATESAAVAALNETFQGIGDFDGDGDGDILWRNANGVVFVVVIEDGVAVETVSIGDASNDWTILGVGDFDADDDSDILWRHTSGLLAIWVMEDLQNVNDLHPRPISEEWSLLGIADFNGDGFSDVLWRNNTNGETMLWLMENGVVFQESSPPVPTTP